METSAHITAAVFAAYLKCQTKGFLLAHGEKSLNSYFADIHRDISVAYIHQSDFGRLRVLGVAGSIDIE
jgi:hypothetical protein